VEERRELRQLPQRQVVGQEGPLQFLLNLQAGAPELLRQQRLQRLVDQVF
jgi:hypothetical protein